jgi:hypothetical protein
MAILATSRKWLVTSLWAAVRSPCSRQLLASMYSSCGSNMGKPPDLFKITGQTAFGGEYW